MGGEGQPQAQAALATRIIDFGYDVQQAIEAPRWLMGRTWARLSQHVAEGRISDEVVRELKRRGQPVQMVTDWNETRATRRDPGRSRKWILRGWSRSTGGRRRTGLLTSSCGIDGVRGFGMADKLASRRA